MSERRTPFIQRTVHPVVRDAYQKGFQDGVLTTLDELAKNAWDDRLPDDISTWVESVREHVEADKQAEV